MKCLDEPICYSSIKTIEKLSDRKSSVTNLYANSKWGVLLALRDNGIAVYFTQISLLYIEIDT